MLLSSNDTSRKEYVRSKKAAKDMEQYQQQTTLIDSLREQDMDAWLQANYLYDTAGMPCYGNSKTTYYSVGEDFHAALLDELRKAERFIFMEYFIVQEGQMWNPIHEILKEKTAQGVSVYFMYDDFGCIATLPWHYHKVLCNEGIHCVIANICDDKFAVCGTINMDYRSLVHHFECDAWMYDTDCIADMKADFLDTLVQLAEIRKDRAVMRSWQRLLAETMKVFSPLF